METLDLTLRRNDSKKFKVEITDEVIGGDGDDLDLSDWSYSAQIRRTEDSEDILASFDFDASDAATGTLWVILQASATTQTLEDALYGSTGVWDLQITSSDATPLVITTHAGVVSFTDDVTRS